MTQQKGMNKHVIVTNVTCLTLSDHDKGLDVRLALTVVSAPYRSRRRRDGIPGSWGITRLKYVLARFHSNFEGQPPGGGQRPPISLFLPPTSQEDLWLDGYLEYPMSQKHYSFTIINAFCGIRAPVLRHSIQRH
ncbi:hypothetical protein TNCV_1841281 [Trichonephila clavipes]|nr:hypothetical protein TNCV_1841281 [Trichonephila clavipes]